MKQYTGTTPIARSSRATMDHNFLQYHHHHRISHDSLIDRPNVTAVLTYYQ